MSAKRLGILAVVLVVLAVAAFLTRPTGPAGAVRAPGLGDPVLPELDINQTQRITIESPTGTNELVRARSQWVVASLHEYPADFVRLREQLTGLQALKIGQVMRGDAATRQETGVGDGAKVVTLHGSNDTVLATLRIGQARTGQSAAGGFGGYPDGQYLAVDDESILVVAGSLHGWSERPADWIARQLLQVDAEQVASIAVDDGTQAYQIQIDTNQVMTLEGLGAEETFDAGAAGRLKRALSYLSCQDVADPSLTDEAMGFDEPARYVATLRDGTAYTVTLGAVTNSARYARFAITGGEPAPDEDEDPDRALIQEWTYLIPTYSAESMTVSRETIVKPVEPEPEPEAEEESEPAAEPEPQWEAAPTQEAAPVPEAAPAPDLGGEPAAEPDAAPLPPPLPEVDAPNAEAEAVPMPSAPPPLPPVPPVERPAEAETAGGE